VNVQGLLTNSADEPIADGTCEVTFAIYDVENGGNALWTETRTVTTEGGLFTIILGETNPLAESVFTNPELWLGITVSGDTEMTPRQRLTSVPYALNRPEAESADTGNNVVTGLWAAIAGGKDNRADGDSSFIGGGAQNEVTGDGATIAGGINNLASGLHSSIGGGGGRTRTPISPREITRLSPADEATGPQRQKPQSGAAVTTKPKATNRPLVAEI